MSSNSGTSRVVVIAAVVIGLAVGVGAALLLRPSSGGSDTRLPAATGDTTRDGDPDAAAELPEPDPVTSADQAEDPESAIRGFLAAEAIQDWDTSYTFLTQSLKDVAYTTPASWISQHADFPTVTGYRVDDIQVDEDAGTARVLTLTGFDAKLDPVIGLVAARGRTTWSLEQQDDGLWRVNTNGTENQPLYPNSEGASDAVRNWVDARVACEDTSDLEAGLVGSPSQARLLCEEDQDDPVQIEAIGPLTDSSDVATLLAQFGPDVFAWARTARVQATTPIVAVLAPIGQEWRVVGVLPAR
ncbi:MAG: hypothetical protein ACR2HR_14155 [Euzebya sp.]